MFSLLLAVSAFILGNSNAHASEWDILPCAPSSDFVEMDGNDFAFCADWNPEFAFRGFRCCPKGLQTRRGKGAYCSPQRVKSTYCDEMTQEQRFYSEAAASGHLGDVLELIDRESAAGFRKAQAFCTVNSGFLAWGRRLIPSALNRIKLRRPERCLDFGTDPMVGMLEWVGRQINRQYPIKQYPGAQLLVGDISAPRGGCLSGRRGRRGHASHTSGQDVDIGFFVAKEGKDSPAVFQRELPVETEWWLLKEIFKNPYACVKVIFLDKKHINKLARKFGHEPEWQRYGRFLRHQKRHKDHTHVRIGDGPGQAGCIPDAKPELEELDMETEPESDGGN